ncbi:MAG TPA: ADOP family duplicated permease, partial [Vicinamibacterales bacterium]
LLGVNAERGRRFRPDEAAGAAMLGHAAWQRLFNGDPAAVGRSLTLDGFTYTIVGVLPDSFRLDLPTLPREIDVWKVPDAWWQNGDIWADENVSTGVLQFVARLKADVTEVQARHQVAQFAEHERARQSTVTAAGFDLAMVPLHASMVRDAQPVLVVLFGSVACLLLIACANVTNLGLVRMHNRRRELAVRLALGSSLSRLVRLFVVESAVLASLGGIAGVVLARDGIRILTALGPANLPRISEVSVDFGVVAYAALLTTACSLVSGLFPTILATRQTYDLRLAGGTAPGRVRIGGTIAAAQIAVSIVLVLAASLLGRSLLRLNNVRPGFDADRVLTFSVSLPGTRYHRPDGTDRFMRTLENGIASMSQVRAAGTIWPLPLSGRRWSGNYIVGTDPAGGHGLVDYRLASGGVFDALGTRLLEGRTFAREERRDVIVVGRAFAELAWPNERAIGRIVQAVPWGGKPSAFEVIGVVDDMQAQTLKRQATPALYFDMRRWSWTDWEMNVVVRTNGDPLTVVPAIRAEVGRLDPEVPMAQVRSLDEYIADELSSNRFALFVVGLFAIVAVILALVGLYGVVSYAVGQRRREFGVRMALGADRARIVRLVLGGGIRVVSSGIGAGLLFALWVMDALSGLLFGTRPHDPVTFAGVASIVFAVAMLACYVPARRAARVEPLETLRAE